MFPALTSRFFALAVALIAATGAIAAWAGPAGAEQVSGQFVFNIELTESKPQMAVWLADESGRFVDTVFVTRKVGQKGLGNRQGELDDMMGGPRLSTLPVWAYAAGKDYGGGNPYPPEDQPLPDAVSGASPKAGELNLRWKPLYPLDEGKYLIFVEINVSFDENEKHDYSWYRGQPSVVWRGEIMVGRESLTAEAQIVGHGDPAGANGRIEADVSTLTTALDLIRSVRVAYLPDSGE